MQLISATGLETRLLMRSGAKALAFASLANALLAGALLFKEPPVRTVVVPPSIGVAQERWTFDEAGPDRAYLERWARDLSSLLMTVSPATVDRSIAVLLEHVDPEVHGALEVRLREEAAALKRDDASSVFYPLRTVSDRKSLTVEVTGTLVTIVGKRVSAKSTVTERFEFRHEAGRLFLKSLRRSDADD